MGIIRLKAGIWKLRGIGRGFERGRCPLCLGEEDAKHILLKCSETKKWREECVNSKWLDINEDLAYKKIISCTNVNKIKFLGKYLFKTKCIWETLTLRKTSCTSGIEPRFLFRAAHSLYYGLSRWRR
jgi:hypothetical protein